MSRINEACEERANKRQQGATVAVTVATPSTMRLQLGNVIHKESDASRNVRQVFHLWRQFWTCFIEKVADHVVC